MAFQPLPRIYGQAVAQAAAHGLRIADIQNVAYNTLDEYYEARDIGFNVFDVRDGLQAQAPQGVTYQVFAELPDYTADREEVDSHDDFRRMILENLADDSDALRQAFFHGGPLSMELTIVRIEDRERAANAPHDFRGTSRSRFWGPLGRVNNCVVRQVSDRVEGYLSSNSKRDYMWGPSGQRYSTDRCSPHYNPSAARKLAQDKTYINIKKGVAEFLRNRDLNYSDSFGFDVRDLCELAELCGIRIRVWMNTRTIPLLRWDTDDKVPCSSEFRDKRYVFDFWMTGTQHLEMCESGDGRLAKARLQKPEIAKIEYVDDSWFVSLFGTGYPPGFEEDDPEGARIFTVARSCLRWPLPEEAKEYRYADCLVRESDTVYKHIVYKDWLRAQDIDPDDTKHADIMCVADIHWSKLRNNLNHNNMGAIYQRQQPSLFEAVAYADKVTTHTLTTKLPVGDMVWEVDGRKWYATRFADIPDFPYFHGFPAANVWSEYSGTKTKPVYSHETGTFQPQTSYIGNICSEDRPFTFEYGKYAIFLVEQLDFQRCDDHTMEHFRRDKIFVDFDSGTSVLPLASPVLHFLQDQGVRWRASHVWVCYGVVDDWIVGQGGMDADILRDEMIEHKTYAISAGRLMAGRWPVQSTKYITPDEEVAQDLLAWHSAPFVIGPTEDMVWEGVHRRHAPHSLIMNETADVYGAKTISGSTLSRGGVFTRRADGPFVVNCKVDMYGMGRTMAHISGAIHALCFVRLYSAALCIPAEDVAGFSLDSIKCFRDPTSYLEAFISDSDSVAGSFKPAEYKTLARAFRSHSPLLSPLYAPRAAFQGIATPDTSKPLWGSYQDSLKQFNIVTGKAGSGKTWRHLRLYDGEDQRLDKVLYAPLTNYLAAQLRSQGIPAVTSFKAFNRRVDDSSTVRTAKDRYDSDKDQERTRLDGFAVILRDEITMDSAGMVLDAVKCCNENHRQLLLVGDFDRDRFYQLSAVRQGGPELMTAALREAAQEIGRKQIHWVPEQPVYRQAGDPGLVQFLEKLRYHTGGARERWQTLATSDLFEHRTYDDMLRLYNPETDIIINPWHKNIEEVTEAVLSSMQDTDKLMLRANFQCPYKTKDSDPDPIRRLVVFEGDDRAHKGVTCQVTKAELNSLRGTRFMAKGFPYKGGSSDGNMVNPMIGATVFALQGVTLTDETTLWVMAANKEALEWLSDEQPCSAYVTSSRARRREQIKIVVRDRHVRRRL